MKALNKIIAINFNRTLSKNILKFFLFLWLILGGIVVAKGFALTLREMASGVKILTAFGIVYVLMIIALVVAEIFILAQIF